MRSAASNPYRSTSASGMAGLRIPNFNLFKQRLVLAVLGAIALIGGSVWAFYLAPSAHIYIEGQTSRIATDSQFTADTSLTEPNFEKKELPATSQELKKELSEPATPTGQKNLGEKSVGTMSLKNCEDTLGEVTLPKGTKFTANGLTFTSDESVTLPQSIFAGGGGNCVTSSKSVDVTAAEAGDQYNLSSRSYNVSGHPDIRATGSDMSGGTNNIVTILTQVDVDKARDAALTKLDDGARDALFKQFAPEIYVISASSTRSVDEVTPSVPIDERADTASVKVAVTYSALGVKKDIMTDFLKSLQQPSLQPNQAIFNTGLDTASLASVESPKLSRQVFQIKTDGFAGPAVDLEQARKDLAGKGFGEAKKQLESLPGVTKADIRLSPFWVFSMPRQADHIHIEIKVN